MNVKLDARTLEAAFAELYYSALYGQIRRRFHVGAR